MSNPDKKLFLLDAFALIYRAYYAFIKNPRINSKGLNTSAVLGFCNTLLDVLNKQSPTHIAVVFDTPGPTDRVAIYPEYKANREAMPEDIALAIPYIKELIEGFNIPILELPGYEADDIIGTLSTMAEAKGFTTYMMTPDKDFGQLITDKVFVFKPPRAGNPAEVLGVKEICEKFEIKEPKQLIDILGLWGDAVDNIPGVPGVGEKTAKKLIGEFGSIENLLKNTDKLKGKLKENVENFAEQALLSKQLATIILDSPVEFDEDKLKLQPWNNDALMELFTELEFRQLAQKILSPGDNGKTEAPTKRSDGPIDLFSELEGESFGGEIASPFQTISDTKHSYHLVDTDDKRKDLLEKLNKQKTFCFDTETTGLDPIVAEMVGISFSFKSGEAYYVPVPEDYQDALSMVNEFKELFENEGIGKTGQNIKYDILILKNYDVTVKGELFDTMIAHYVLRPDMRHNMNVLAETYLNYSPVSIETLIGKKGRAQISIRQAEIKEVSEYACEDADITFQLREKLEPLVKEEEAMKLLTEIELPLITVLADMEAEGIKLDSASLKKLSGELGDDIIKLEGEIHEHAGTSFNVDSPKQLGDILFETLKIDDKPKKTKTGQYATSEDILSKLIHSHDIVPKILEFRGLRKLKSTYVDSLPEMVNAKTGKIHTSYNQAVAATGRLSSDRPNLQNIPIRTERGREVRKAFIPTDDKHTLLSADYSQVELRIIAELSEDENMIEAFVLGVDIHTSTASKIFNVPMDEVTRELRGKSKAVNFGISYGQTAFGLAQNLNIPRKDAKEIIDNFFGQYQKLRTYMDSNIEFARKNGYVETIMGRRRHLKDINSGNAIVRGHAERNAINAPIQGSAADMIKIAMINIHREMAKLKMNSKMILQVHDELVFDAVTSELDELKSLVDMQMKSAIKMKVPLVVDMGVGNNWLEAH